MSKTLSIDLIRTEGDMQGRAEFSPEHIADLKAAWEAKADLPPLLVFFDGTDYWLADGFHRLDAAKLAKRASVQCDIEKGTRRDAWLAALKANQVHGLRRTNADKRKVVTRALSDAELVTWADSRIAEHIGVTHPFVAAIRRELVTVTGSPAAKAADKPRVGRDGKSRNQPTTKAGKKPQAESISEFKEEVKAANSGPCPHGGEHDYDDEACRNCHDPKPAVKQYNDPFNPADFSDSPLDLKAKQAAYDRMLNSITAIQKEWNAVTADERDGVYAVDKRNRVNRLLEELRPPIAQARPHAICDHCTGKGCKKCQNCGWWPRSVVEGLKR